jgi:hypothetical protein
VESGRALIEHLVATVPALDFMLNELMQDYDSLVPHVFFGELVPWAEDASTSSDEDVERLLSVLDSWYVTANRYG